MRDIWDWPIWAAGTAAGLFVIIDGAFLSANLAKVMQGGWVPLAQASLVYGVMWIWHRGRARGSTQHRSGSWTPLSSLLEKLHAGEVARVPGTAAVGCFSPASRIRRRRLWTGTCGYGLALHEYVLALTLTVLSARWTDPEERLNLERIDDRFWRAEARRGFMERPDIQEILGECKAKGAEIDLHDVTYYVGHETIVPRENGKGMARWQEVLFAAMGRNAERISDYLDLPCDRTVEIGREVEI